MEINKYFGTEASFKVFNLVIPGLITPRNPVLTQEQRDILSGTSLHSLVEPDSTITLKINVEDMDLSFDIPPVGFHELEPRRVYDITTKEPSATSLRIPTTHIYANALFKHTSNGREPLLEGFMLALAGDMTRLVDKSILRTRFSPGISALAMGGE